jgi:hypothetical protein
VPNMDAWTTGALVVGGFIAVSSLVQLMRRRRDALLADLTAQAREEQHRQKMAELLEKKKQKRKAA